MSITNTVFHGNTAGSAPAAALSKDGAVDFINNVVSDNICNTSLYSSQNNGDYNVVWNNTATGDQAMSGTGNLEANPYFTDAAAGDFTLRPGYSPLIDAGNPASGYNDPDGSRNDMGAYGGPHGDWP